MKRQKKIKSLQLEQNHPEVPMTDQAVLEQVQTEIDLARLELEKTKCEIEEKKKELQHQGRRQLDNDEKKTDDRHVSLVIERKASSDLIAKQKAMDSVKVTGKFMNRRAPGQAIKLPYIKYQDDPVKWYHFEDGKVYTIPKGFADQINEYYHTPQFVQKQGQQAASSVLGENSAIAEVDTSNKKYAFVPVNF
jgi:hypothetical protein